MNGRKMGFSVIKDVIKHALPYLPLLIFSVLIALFLVVFHVVQSFALFAEEYFVLVRSSQTVSAWFFSSYVHYDWEHLFANIGVWIICSALICVMAGFRKMLENPLPKHYFIWVLALLLLLFPFILSLVNITLTLFNKTMGFSGISFALCGVLIYLIISFLSSCETKKQKRMIGFLSLLLTLLIFASSLIPSPTNMMTTNHLGHSVGFIFGLIVAGFCEWKLQRREGRIRR